MKNLLIIFLSLISLQTYCQETEFPESKPRKWRIGGGVGVGFGSYDYFSASITPNMGYELIPQVEVGVSAGYEFAKRTNYKHNLFTFGPYVNYYPIQSLFVRAQLEQFVGNYKYDTYFNNEPYKGSYEETSLWLGGGYRTTGPIQFFAGVLYNVLYEKDESLYSSGFRPFLGVSFGL